ncbi:MAG: SusC/RagA family TonB-linked outer membrane protein [Bacteroidia bacterium]
MKQIVRLAFVLIGMAMCNSLFAQDHVISGTVKDQSGKPLPFLAVVVKGTTIGTYTDTAGKFTLTVDQKEKTLTLSYPGMKTQEVAISDNMSITMTSDALGLDEVVVSAVGISQEKKQLGYATQVVGSDQLNQTGTSNMMDELDAKVSGLQVINSAGDPGAGTYINLRGPTSLTGNNQPLIVVDGIPVDNSINNFDPTYLGFGAGGAGGALNGGTQPTNRGLDINPSDIESVTVLKGPAATALYGISAANGALIITTKKGHKNGDGSLGIEFNSSLTFSTVNQLPAYQQQYAQGDTGTIGTQHGVPVYSGPTSGERNSWGPAINTLSFYGPATPYDSHGTLAPSGAPGATGTGIAYNPYDFFQTGVATDNNISFTGGNDKSGFRVALGNLYQTGVIPLSSYTKTNININGQTALSKRLKVSAGVNYINSVNDKVQQGNNTSGVMFLERTPPTFDNSNGNGKNAANITSTYMLPSDSERDYRGGTPGYDNPYWTVNENTLTSTLNRVLGNAQLDYNITDWLTLTYRVGGDAYVQDDKGYQNPLSNSLNYEGGTVYVADFINTILNSDLILNMNKKLSDKFNLDVMLGQNYYNQTTDDRLASGTGLTLPAFPNLANSTSFVGTQEGEYPYRRSAWYGQAVLGYASQLFLTVTGRDETTSTLAANNDNFFYPSVDLGWVFTETFHMATNKILPYGKLRLSYANVGQDAPVQSLTTPYRTASIADGYTTGITFPYNGIPGFATSTAMGNLGLLPQNTASTEVGLDLAFLQNRISFSGTYYNETTTNEILSVPVPYSSGYGSEELNAGEVTNKGVEITINTTPVKTRSFQWDLGINWSKNVNDVVKLAQVGKDTIKNIYLDALGTLVDAPGYSMSQIYGTDYYRVGNYNPANPNQGLVLDDQPGPNYGLPMANTSAAPKPLASTQPDWIGGVTTSFTYKTNHSGAITLGAVMSIREGGYMWDGTIGAMEYYGTYGYTAQNYVGGNGVNGVNGSTSNNTYRGAPYQVPSGAVWGHVNADGSLTTDASAPAAGETATYGYYYYRNLTSIYNGLTTPNIYPAGYVRISQINLSYSLPANVCRKIHFTKIALTVFANNPILWTKYPGVDPETSFAGPANAQGEDWFNNPGTKSYGVRLNVGL